MKSLSRRIGFLWVVFAILAATIAAVAILAVLASIWTLDERLVPVVWGILVVVGVVYAILKYRRWGIEIQDDALFLTRGVVTHVDTSVPYVRVQHIETRRRPIERLFGLASVVVYTAGSRGADIRIPGLGRRRASEVRERLRELSIESEATDAV